MTILSGPKNLYFFKGKLETRLIRSQSYGDQIVLCINFPPKDIKQRISHLATISLSSFHNRLRRKLVFEPFGQAVAGTLWFGMASKFCSRVGRKKTGLTTKGIHAFATF